MTEEQKRELFYPKKKLNPNWILKGMDNDAIIWAESFGKYLTQDVVQDDALKPKKQTLKDGKEIVVKGEPLTTSQLRRFFGNLKKIEADHAFEDTIPQTAIIMLIPQLAYAVGRAKNRENDKIRDFYQEAKKGIETTLTSNNRYIFKNFVKLFEAIVAYHKFNGGKDSSKN